MPSAMPFAGSGKQGLRAGPFAETLLRMPCRSSVAVLALLASLPAFFGCASNGLSYSGDSQRRVLAPALLGSGDEAPPGQHRLGHLSAGCTLADAREGLDGVPLSNVGCSTALLRAALRERAAVAGATFLVDLQCDPAGDFGPGERHAQCSADAWGPRVPERFVPPAVTPALNVDPLGAAAPLAPAYGSVHEAWKVLVDYWPAPGRSSRAPVPPEQVSEVDFPRVGFARLGEVRARSDREVSMDTLRAALRAAAARVGATSVVAPRCIAGEEMQLCIASVSAVDVPGEAPGDKVAEAR